MGEKVPLVIYKDGERIVIGEAEINGDDIEATITITDEAIVRKLNQEMMPPGSLSIDSERRNVFDEESKKS